MHRTRFVSTSLIGFFAAAAALSSAGAAHAGQVYQSLNEELSPAPFFWGAPSGKIGWYWTPADDVSLTGVETRLSAGFSNINNNYTFTTTLYTDRPAAGGTPIASFTWNGATTIDDNWLGGFFDEPLDLSGGTQYFLGMSGWEQALADFGGGGGSGVNWIDPPNQPGGENLGAGSGYTGDNFELQMNTTSVPANVDSPILRFMTPEPSTLSLLGLAAATPLRRRPA